MTRRTQQIILHITGCVVFLALPFLFSPETLNLHDYLTNPPTQRDIIAYILLLGAFYFNFYLLIPRLYFQRKYPLFIVTNLLFLSCVLFLPRLLIHPHNMSEPIGFMHMVPPNPGTGPALYFIQNHRMPPIRFILDEHFFLFLVVLFLALLIKIRDRWVRAEDEKLHAELAYLKSQINPHFLFNTLNSIYSMALGRSDHTAGAIVSLSSMMRYVLDEAGREKVPLTKEIAYITDYIQLQQTRFEGSLQTDLSINGKPDGKTIAPLLLIPFVENAFKYGVNPEEPSTIGIRIDIGDDDLRLKVTNKKVAIVSLDATPSGLGIQNTRRRLELLYPGRHALEIQDEQKTFTVLLYLSRI